MILIDYNNFVISSVTESLNKLKKIEPNYVRFAFFKKLGKIMSQFKSEYGMPVICRDGKGYWRREVFKNYKAKRNKARAESSMDWDTVFYLADVLAKEMEEVFGYLVLNRDMIEADDTIASIVRNYPVSRHLIVGSDKDFQQLKIFGNVEQWDIIKSDFVTIPEDQTLNDFMLLHIVKGDNSDGIPSVLSGDDFLVEGIRQKPISKKMLESISDVDVVFGASSDELAKAIYESPEFAKVLNSLGLDYSRLHNQVARNMHLICLNKKNDFVDEYVKYAMENYEYKKMDFASFMTYCATNGLTEIASNAEVYTWQ